MKVNLVEFAGVFFELSLGHSKLSAPSGSQLSRDLSQFILKELWPDASDEFILLKGKLGPVGFLSCVIWVGLLPLNLRKVKSV